jgi:hypothetical protein
MGFKTAVGAQATASVGGSNGPSRRPAVASSPSGGSIAAPGGWHPTVLYMGGLVAGEIVAVAILSRHLLK